MSGKLSEWVLSYGYSQASQAYQDQVQAVFIREHDHCAHVLGSTQTGEIRHFHFFKEVHFFRKKISWTENRSRARARCINGGGLTAGTSPCGVIGTRRAQSSRAQTQAHTFLCSASAVGINHRLAPGPQPCV